MCKNRSKDNLRHQKLQVHHTPTIIVYSEKNHERVSVNH